ncbi:MAG: hypothetical protein FJ405_19245 [Verrucomicrobia bacterium]|nr:hypothetical protein [Verrucomicrobiota bacterium]
MIATPWRVRFQSLFFKTAPGLMFVGVCAACAVLWNRAGFPTEFVGDVEIGAVVVSAPDGGTLTNVWGKLHEHVAAGTPLAEIVTTDPRTVSSRLAVMRGRMHLTELEMSPVLGQQRNALDYAQLSLNVSRLKVELATARVNLERAISELRRSEALQRQNLISEEAVDVSRKAQQALEAEVREKSAFVTEAEKTLLRLSYLADTFVPGGENDPLRQALRVQESQTRALEDKIRPLPLHAPIEGVITAVFSRSGEHVIPGAPILEITPAKPERILGRLPKSMISRVQPGMLVSVSTRGLDSESGWGRVLGMSPALKIETNLTGRSASPLPYQAISISIPTKLSLMPGEPVNISLRHAAIQ